MLLLFADVACVFCGAVLFACVGLSLSVISIHVVFFFHPIIMASMTCFASMTAMIQSVLRFSSSTGLALEATVFFSPRVSFCNHFCFARQSATSNIIITLACMMSSSDSEEDVLFVGFPADSGTLAGAEEAVEDAADFGGFLMEETDVSGDSDSDEVMIADPVDRFREASPLTRNRSRLQAATSGVFWAFVTTRDEGRLHILGMAEFRWGLGEPDYSKGDRLDCGLITYVTHRIVLLQSPVEFPDGSDFNDPAAAFDACGDSILTPAHGSVTVDAFLIEEAVVNRYVVECTQAEATALRIAQVHCLFRKVRVRTRGSITSALPQPEKTNLKRWRKEVRDGYARQDTRQREGVPMGANPRDFSQSHLFFLPERVHPERWDQGNLRLPGRLKHVRSRKTIDPIRLVHALDVTQHLRMPDLFEKVLEASQDYLALDAGERVEHDYYKDPKKFVLQQSQARSDVLEMLLNRRRFKQWRADDAVKSMHLYSDGSPVTGDELQGMILDVIFRDGSLEQMIFPGSTLAFGHTDTVSKGVALVWALWLVSGPTVDDLLWACSKVRSLTTDFGVEMHLLELPDIAAAFVTWVGGVPLADVRPLVRSDRRMFGRALRIAGWSHTLGGIMKHLAEKSPDWPKDLGHLRALCKFWRISSYRTHIARRLKGVENVENLCKSFTAGFAKWRYETVVQVLKQLTRRRAICQEHLKRAHVMFPKAEDQELVSSVCRACSDVPFWKWCAVALDEVFDELEQLRTWGMVCDHVECYEQRKRSNFKKRIDCPRIHNYLLFKSKTQTFLNPFSLPPNHFLFHSFLHSCL